MRPYWFGRFFSLWPEAHQWSRPCFRIGGPEAGRLFGGLWPDAALAPDEFHSLYMAIFEGILKTERSDLLVSTLHDKDRRRLAGLLQPLETLALPVEWDDHYFEVLTAAEFEGGKAADYSTVCFASPSSGVREALAWIWTVGAQLCFPLVGLQRGGQHLLTGWQGCSQVEGDARALLLHLYAGLVYLSCPAELYLVGGADVLAGAIVVLEGLELELARDGRLQRARDLLVCSVDGTYYAEDDPRTETIELAGRLRDLAAPIDG